VLVNIVYPIYSKLTHTYLKSKNSDKTYIFNSSNIIKVIGLLRPLRASLVVDSTSYVPNNNKLNNKTWNITRNWYYVN